MVIDTRRASTTTFPVITCVQFSPVHPAICAVATMSGYVYLFDLLSSEATPLFALEPGVLMESSTAAVGDDHMEGEEESAASASQPAVVTSSAVTEKTGFVSCAFNSHNRSLLSACDVHGRVHVWRLNGYLSNRATASTFHGSHSHQAGTLDTGANWTQYSFEEENRLMEQLSESVFEHENL